MSTTEHEPNTQVEDDDIVTITLTLGEAITTITALGICKTTRDVTPERAESVIAKLEQAIETV